MTLSSREIRQLCDEFSQLHDDALDETRQRVLAERVQQEPEVRKLYQRYMRLLAGLQWDLGEAGREAAPRLDRPEPEAKPSPSPPLHQILFHRFGRQPVAYLSSIVVVWWALWLAFAGTLNWESDPETLVASRVAPPKSAARLTYAFEAVWKEGDGPSLQAPWMHAGKRFTLVAGWSELTFASGARAVVQAPAEFVCDNRLRLQLLSGKVVVEADEGARGFTVDTPGARVVDWGTQFGVEIDAAGATSTYVYQGKVTVQAKNSPTDLPPRVATAGEGVHVTAEGRLQPTPANLAARFVKRAPRPAAPQLSEHAQRVLALRPTLYYSMEPREPGVLFDLGAAGRHVSLQPQDGVSPWGEGAFGHALQLRGGGFRDYVIVSSYPKATGGALSVSAWVWADSHSRWATIAKNWARLPGQFHLGLDANSGRLSIYVVQLDGVPIRACENEIFPLAAWQHVAATADDRELRLYRNGRLVAAVPCTGVKLELDASPLGIGVKPDLMLVASKSPDAGFWHGKLDEIAVFPHALSAEQVADLARREEPTLTHTNPNGADQ